MREMCELLHTWNQQYFDGNNKGALYPCADSDTHSRIHAPRIELGRLISLSCYLGRLRAVAAFRVALARAQPLSE